MSTPRTLELPGTVRRVTIETRRGEFAALEALPASRACDRQPALLVPGYTGSKEDFVAVLGPLAAAGRRVVAIDLRGQYQSPGATLADDYALAALAADVALIAEQVAARQAGSDGWQRRPHLLGHSFGGLVARELVLSCAARVSSLTLMSSGPGALTGPRAAILEWVLTGLRPVPPGALPGEIERLWETQLEPEAVADRVPAPIIEFLRTRLLASCPVGLRSMGETLLSCPDRTAALARLAVPLLVLYGEDDDAWAPAIQEEMAKRLDATRVCVPAAGHSPAVDAPETVASTLTAFWNAAETNRAQPSAAHLPTAAGDRPQR